MARGRSGQVIAPGIFGTHANDVLSLDRYAETLSPTFFATSTKDDRVHPAHARKMMAMMEAAGKDVRYYENIEGGHGGAANNAQAAHMNALAYTFLWQQLTK